MSKSQRLLALKAKWQRGEITQNAYQEQLEALLMEDEASVSTQQPGQTSIETVSEPEEAPPSITETRNEGSSDEMDTVYTKSSTNRVDGASGIGEGTSLGPYNLTRFIDCGGMGEVWEGWDVVGDRTVVLKFLPSDLRRQTEEMAQVKHTFQRVQALHHEHICPLYSLGLDENLGYYLVMKFIEGATLSQHIKEHGTFSLSRVIQILTPVAAALDYAHRNKVIHRDIKPGNLMVSPDLSDVQVIDFGLAAQVRTSLSRVTMGQMGACGTPQYMAPEQWKGLPQDGKTDQYALAVVAYELLLGRAPFVGDLNILRMCTLNDPIPHIQDQPDVVNASLAKAMAKDPGDRFADCADFIQAIAQGLMPGSSNLESAIIDVNEQLQLAQFQPSPLHSMCVVIQTAIQHGVHLYNAGNEDLARADFHYTQCAALYLHATTELVHQIDAQLPEAQLPGADAAALSYLRRTSQWQPELTQTNGKEYAWVLREGFDTCLTLQSTKHHFEEIERLSDRIEPQLIQGFSEHILSQAHSLLQGRSAYGFTALLDYYLKSLLQLTSKSLLSPESQQLLHDLPINLELLPPLTFHLPEEEVVQLATHLQTAVLQLAQREPTQTENLADLQELLSELEKDLQSIKHIHSLRKDVLRQKMQHVARGDALPCVHDEIAALHEEIDINIPQQKKEIEAEIHKLKQNIAALKR